MHILTLAANWYIQCLFTLYNYIHTSLIKIKLNTISYKHRQKLTFSDIIRSFLWVAVYTVHGCLLVKIDLF